MRFITTNHFAEISMSASGGKATSHFRERRLLTGACHDVFYDRDGGGFRVPSGVRKPFMQEP
uniref:hypothetical protein n=1 Tax=uncultured Rhizobium sp. TaxID=155567 RepID=UPI0026309F29